MPKGSAMNELEFFCHQYGVKLVHKGGTHYQLTGKMVVNYYPGSRKQTAYLNGATHGKSGVTAEQAVRMAMEVPEIVPKCKRLRRKNDRAWKKSVLAKFPFCHWCGKLLDVSTATVDHVIPLSRGGANFSSNKVLSCFNCNHERGNHMPEVAGPLKKEYQDADVLYSTFLCPYRQGGDSPGAADNVPEQRPSDLPF